MGFMALITALVLCARSQDSLLSVSVRRVLNPMFLQDPAIALEYGRVAQSAATLVSAPWVMSSVTALYA